MELRLAPATEPARVIASLAGGVRMVLDLSDHAVSVNMLRRRYELNELDFVRATVGPGWHVVDGGAHAGLYALTMAAIVGRGGSVDAFEPISTNVECLALGVTENRFEGIVRVEPAALSNVTGSGEMVLATCRGNAGAAYLRRGVEPVPVGFEARTVRTLALDDHLALGPIDFIRLDIEGAEGLALAGAERVLDRQRPLVLAELHSFLLPRVSGMTAEALIAWMRRFGYRCRLLGAGVPGDEVSDTPSNGVHSVVFLQ